MALKYLLDTNAISEAEKSFPNSGLMQKLQKHHHECALSSVTWHELIYGYHCLLASKRKDRIADFIKTLKVFPVLAFEQNAAEYFAKERARLKSLGLKPAYADGQIAAIASSQGLILVTRNIGDFENFSNLKVENWFL